MGAVVACGSCGRRFRVGRRKAGKTIACPHCGADIFVPPADLQGELDLGGDDASADDALTELLGAGSESAAAPTLSESPYPAATATPFDDLARRASAGGGDFGLGAGPGAAPSGGPSVDLLAYGAGALPPAGKVRFRPVAPAPEWYANPIYWAAIVVPLIALLVIASSLAGRRNAHRSAATAEAVATGDLASALAAATPASVATTVATPEARGPAAVVGVGAGDGPVGQEVTLWKAVVDPGSSVSGVLDTVQVATGRERRVTFADNGSPSLVVRDVSEPQRVVLATLTIGAERAAWRGVPVDPLAEAVGTHGQRYACLLASGGGFEIFFGEGRDWSSKRVPVSWRVAGNPAPLFFGFSEDERLLIVPPAGDEIQCWDAANAKLLATWKGSWGESRGDFAMSPGGKYLAVFTRQRHLVVLGVASGEVVGEAMAVELKDCRALKYSIDGKRIAGLFADGRLVVWDAEKGRRVGAFPLAELSEAAASFGATPAERTPVLQSLIDDAGWLVDGRWVVSPSGATRRLPLDDARRPAFAVGGRFLVNFQRRDGIDFLAVDPTPLAAAP